MVDSKRLVRAILNARSTGREPNGQEVAMVHVALTREEPPRTLAELLDVLGDSNLFDYSIDLGLVGQLLKTVETDGDQPLDAFVERWAS